MDRELLPRAAPGAPAEGRGGPLLAVVATC